jgi:hypothetical protein
MPLTESDTVDLQRPKLPRWDLEQNTNLPGFLLRSRFRIPIIRHTNLSSR